VRAQLIVESVASVVEVSRADEQHGARDEGHSIRSTHRLTCVTKRAIIIARPTVLSHPADEYRNELDRNSTEGRTCRTHPRER
jgi:hypothetical protein